MLREHVHVTHYTPVVHEYFVAYLDREGYQSFLCVLNSVL